MDDEPRQPVSLCLGQQVIRTLVALLALAGGAFAQNTVDGTVQYQDREYTSTGFTGAEPMLPVRFAKVELVRESDGFVLATTSTNAAGYYTFDTTGLTGNAYVRVLALQDTTARNIEIRQQSSPFPIYSGISSTITLPANTTLNFNFLKSGLGPVFNIFDMAVRAQDYISAMYAEQGLAAPTMPKLTIRWQAGSSNGTFFDPTSQIVFLIGTTADPDEYDDDVILHEIGHWAQTRFGTDHSPGGPHSIVDQVDPRLAFSEGWATYFSCAVRRAAGYANPQMVVDNFQSLASAFDVETPSFAAQAIMATNELAVAASLWDIIDANEAAFDVLTADAVNKLESDIWFVIDTTFDPTAPPPSNITLEDFTRAISSWAEFADVTGSSGTERILNHHKIRYYNDPNELNDTTGTAAAVASTVTLPERTLFRVAGTDVDFFSLSLGTPGTLKVETKNLGDGCDTYVELIRASDSAVVASNDNRHSSTRESFLKYKVAASQTGTYYVRVVASSAPSNIMEWGYYDLVLTYDPNEPPVISSLVASVSGGSAPLPVRFDAVYSDVDGQIARVQWDFDDDGRFEVDAFAAAGVCNTFARGGTFTVRLRVTDDDGDFSEQTTAVSVSLSESPAISVSRSTTDAVAPQTYTFTASVSGVTPNFYRWDFNGDGRFDAATTSGSASHVYREAGTFMPVVEVFDDHGHSFRKSVTPLTVPTSTMPTITGFTASVSSGPIPLSVSLTVAYSDAAASISRIEWDFDGDGAYDRQTANTVTTASFVYTRVGEFTPRVRVVRTSGTASTRTLTIRTTWSGATVGWLIHPATGTRLSGNTLSLVAEILPSGTTKTVQFGVRPDGGGPGFANVGSAQSGTGTRFGVFWDISGLLDFTVWDTRALIDGAVTTGDDSNTVPVNRGTPDVVEIIGTPYELQTRVTPSQRGEMISALGVDAFFDYATLQTASDVFVTLRARGSDPSGGATPPGAYLVSSTYEASAPVNAANGFVLRMPFTDADGDGRIDGTLVSLCNLRLYQYTGGQWVLAGFPRLNFSENMLTVHCPQLGAYAFFAIGAKGGKIDASTGSGDRGGGGGGCGIGVPSSPSRPGILSFLIFIALFASACLRHARTWSGSTPSR